MQETQRCDNCGKDIPSSKAGTHFGYCRRNIIKCAICNESYDKNFKEEHIEESHAVKECQDCHMRLKKNQVDQHKQKCQMKAKFCQYCDLNVPVKQYGKHTKVCESRTNKCQKCQADIINKNYAMHIVSCKGKQKPVEKHHYQVEDSLSRFSREMKREKIPNIISKERRKNFQNKQLNFGQKKDFHKLQKKDLIERKAQPKMETRKSNIRNPQEVSRRHFNQNFFPSMGDYDLGSEMDYFDPYQNDFMQQSIFREEMTRPSVQHDYFQIDDEEQLLQQVLMDSKKKAKQYIPQQFHSDLMSQQIMKSSFYKDILDVEKQKAIEMEFSKPKPKKTNVQMKKR